MTRTQLNSQSMAASVAQNLQNNAPLCAGKTEVLASVALHNQNMTVIKDLAVLQLDAKEIIGLVRDKNLLRALMIFNATRIVAGITAYANKNGDNQMAKSVAFPPSTMKRANDNALLAIFQKVSEVANANAAAIIPFGSVPSFTRKILSPICMDLVLPQLQRSLVLPVLSTCSMSSSRVSQVQRLGFQTNKYVFILKGVR